ncbi:MAG TPA: LysE family transporter [Vicinamibacterales bacterium]|nr:LysE family transporter [Vicinamibacterales bacterium]
MIGSVLGDPLYAGFLSFTLVLVATPGATTAVVVRNALDGGRRAGLFAALGAAAANATHATVARLFGAALVTTWPGGLDLVRYLGGGFLAYLGLRGLWALYVQGSAPLPVPLTAVRGSHHRSLREGFAVNLLGPVILTFYLAVVPTFMRPTWPSSAYALLAASHVTLAFVCHSTWVLALHQMRAVFQQHGPRRLLGLAASLAMLALAARVLLR